mgnify:CR=1 FL=1
MTTSPPEKPTKRTRKPSGSREQIYNAAAQLFASKGFAEVSVREISEAAGYGLPTIYHYFKDKLGLYKAVIIGKQLEMENTLEDGLDDVETLDDFKAWLDLLIDNNFRQHELNRLIYREMLTENETLHRSMARRALQPLYEKLRAKLNQVQPGSGDGALPILLLAATLGLVTVEPFRRHLEDYAPAFPQATLQQAEREAWATHLLSLIHGAPADRLAEVEQEVRLLRTAVLRLTLDNTRLQAAIDKAAK